MTEDDARDYFHARFTATQVEKLDAFVTLLLSENQRQNLISPASCAAVWSRHIVDSAQLLSFAPAATRTWADIGSGPGLPGLVIAIIADVDVTLIEPRTRRVEFLHHATTTLALDNVQVHQAKAEAVTGRFDVVSARAVASLPVIVQISAHLRHRHTRLILPRGRNGATEVAQLSGKLRPMFHVEHSVTDPDSLIVIADGV